MIPGTPASPPVIYQGDTFEYIFRMVTDGAAVDLTGVTVSSQIRENVSGPVITALTAQVAVDQVASRGVVLLSLTPTQTTALSVVGLRVIAPDKDLYVLGLWDVQFTWPDGEIRTVLRGPMHLQLEVTR